MTRFSPLSERLANAAARACSHVLPESADIVRPTDLAIAALATGRRARTARARHYQLDCWMDWWESAGLKGHRAGTEAAVRAFLQYLKQGHSSPWTMKFVSSTLTIFLRSIGWPDPRAAIPLRSARKVCIDRTHPGLRRTPCTEPVRLAQIQTCLAGVDQDSLGEVRAAAAMLVLYDTMFREDAIFGHCEGRIWQVAPPPLSDLRQLPDGSGRLLLRTPARAVGYQDCVLTTLTMSWLNRALAARRDLSGPLFMTPEGQPCNRLEWRKTVSRMLKRAGIIERRISGRALRIGKALDLAAEGMTASNIQRTGYWSAIKVVESLIETYSPTSDEPHTGDLFGDAHHVFIPCRGHSSRARQNHRRSHLGSGPHAPRGHLPALGVGFFVDQKMPTSR